MTDSEKEKLTDEELFSKKKKIIDQIKQLSKDQKKEIFKLIVKNKIPYSKNNYGIHIDLNGINYKFIESIENFINYIHSIQPQILKYEKKLKNLKT